MHKERHTNASHTTAHTPRFSFILFHSLLLPERGIYTTLNFSVIVEREKKERSKRKKKKDRSKRKKERKKRKKERGEREREREERERGREEKGERDEQTDKERERERERPLPAITTRE